MKFENTFMRPISIIVVAMLIASMNVLTVLGESDNSSPAGMISYWKFDEDSGPVATDLVGGHNGVIYDATRTTGQSGGALHFDGTNDRVEIADDSAFRPDGEFTTEAWIYLESNTISEQVIFSALWPAYYQVLIIGNQIGLNYYYHTSGYYIVGTEIPTLNAWHHIVTTYEESGTSATSRIYIDGTERTEFTGNPIIRTSREGPVYIGANHDWSWAQREFIGSIDELAVYNRALTASEIQQRYEDGAGGSNEPPVASAGGPYSGDEGSVIALTGATASDPDQDPLTYSWSVDNPVVCSFDDVGTLNPNLTCSDDGTYLVTLTVDDGINDPVSDNATVTIFDGGSPPTPPPCHIINARDFGVVYGTGSPTDSHNWFAWHNFDQSPSEVETYEEANAMGLSVRQNTNPKIYILANVPSDTYRVWIYQMDSPDPLSQALKTTVGADAPVTTHFVHTSWAWQDVGVHVVSPGTLISVEPVGAFIDHGQGVPERRGAFKAIYLAADTTTQPPDFVPDGQSYCMLTPRPCHTINARDFDNVVATGSSYDHRNWFTWYRPNKHPGEVENYEEADAVGVSVRQNIYPYVNTIANVPEEDTYRVWIFQMDTRYWSRALETTIGTDPPVTTHFDNIDVGYHWAWQDVGLHTISPGAPITVKAVGAFTNHGQGVPERRGAFKAIHLTTNTTTQPPDFIPDGQSSCIPAPVNQPPTATAGESYSGDEGSVIALTGATASDPDQDPLTYSWSVDNPVACSFDDVSALNPNLTCSDDGTYLVTLTVDDGINDPVSDNATVTIFDGGPTAVFNWAPDPQGEGSPITFSDGSTSYPDEIVSWDWDFVGLGTSDAQNPVFTFDDNGAYDVCLTVTDDDGSTDTACNMVAVNNVAPTALFGNNGPVDEGTSFNLHLANAFDPSTTDTAVGFEYAFDCGDGNGYGAFGSSNSATCLTDDNGERSVKAQIRDKDGGVNEYTASVEVCNVAPTIESLTAPIDPVDIGNQPVSVEVTFSDPGTVDTHDVTWNWGDEASDKQYGVVSPASQEHSYGTPGVYTFTVTVNDDDGGAASQTYEYIVIYDPEGGFVTGGGWIWSPLGAYVPDGDLEGKATFGFVSKYKKGASIPTGNTEFQFKVADLNFKSTSYHWLVIANTKAMYKGTGTINGEGEYKFMLSAIDGDLEGGDGFDKFRIKIWDKATETVVYDNQLEAAEDADPETVLGGGSIVVHQEK